MYAIAGYVGLEPGVVDEAVLRRMARQLVPDVPDDTGIAVHGRVGLIQRGGPAPVAEHRAGPVTRPPYVMAYAGEVHNLAELRTELAGLGHAFGGDGDAEVVLAAWTRWGAAGLDRCNGRFALAILHLTTGEVTLARDPVGGPPLYYAADGAGRVAFGSDLRAVLATGVVPRRPDGATIYRYLSAGTHDDTERTFVDRVSRVLPGEQVTIVATGEPRRETYTRLYQELELLATTRRPDTAVAREQAGEVMAEAVRRRQPADPAAAGPLPGTAEPVPDRLIEDLSGFIGGQQEPVGPLSAYADYCLIRAIGRQSGVLVGRSAAGDVVAEHLANWAGRGGRRGAGQPPTSHRQRRRAAPVLPVPQLLPAEFAAAHRDLPAPSWSTEDLFRRRLPAVLRYQDRNGGRFAVRRRDPYLDPHLLRVLWSLDPAALREVTGDPTPGRAEPAGWPGRLDAVAAELFGSDSFGARPYVDRSAVLTSYRTSGIDPELCWRLVNLELWLREFVDRDPTIPPASTFVAYYPKSTMPGRHAELVAEPASAAAGAPAPAVPVDAVPAGAVPVDAVPAGAVPVGAEPASAELADATAGAPATVADRPDPAPTDDDTMIKVDVGA